MTVFRSFSFVLAAAFDSSNRELGCAMADTDVDKSFIVLQIIDPKGNCLA